MSKLEEAIKIIKKRIAKDLKEEHTEKTEQNYYQNLEMVIALKEKEIRELKIEVSTLQEAFEYLLADWIEALEERGKSQDEILAQRKSFEKIMYWKQGKGFND